MIHRHTHTAERNRIATPTKMAFIATGATQLPDPTPGEYEAQIVEAEHDWINEKEILELSLRVNTSVSLVRCTLWKTQNSVPVLESAMHSVGRRLKKGEPFDPVAADFLGKTCRVRIGFNKRGYMDVLRWLPPKASEPGSHPVNDRIPERGNFNPPAPVPSRTALPPLLEESDSDDIPF